MRGEDGALSIWLFIGVPLLVYGALILGAGLCELVTSAGRPVVPREVRAGTWWGALLLVLGGCCSWRFRPRRG